MDYSVMYHKKNIVSYPAWKIYFQKPELSPSEINVALEQFISSVWNYYHDRGGPAYFAKLGCGLRSDCTN